MCRQNKLRWNILKDANRNLYRLYYNKEIEKEKEVGGERKKKWEVGENREKGREKKEKYLFSKIAWTAFSN